MESWTTLAVVRAATRLSFVDLTAALTAALGQQELHHGCVVAFCRHTTCLLIVNEWEDGALEDLRTRVAALFRDDVYYAHDDLRRRTQNLVDDERANGRAHVAQMIMGGSSHAIPVAGGVPLLGRWQRLFLFELDEPKDRTVVFHCFGSSATQSPVTNIQNANPEYAP